jgi:MraZ protein
VPAGFRAELGDEKTIYCIASLADPAIDVYTKPYLDELAREFRGDHRLMSVEFRQFQMVMSGDVFPIVIDGDGRIIIPEDLRAYARITDQAVFAGAGPFFQVWEPSTYQAYRAEARRAMQSRLGIENGRMDRRSGP